MAVTVYSKPACPQCNATYRALDKSGISYTSIDVTQDLDAYQHVTSLGYQQVPVVETEGEHWSGFRPDMIKSVAATA